MASTTKNENPNPLPATTPQAFASYLNANFKGDNGKLGGPVAALDSQGATGSTLGAQWLSWYAIKNGQSGTAYTLEQYEEAFVVLWEDAALGGALAAGTAGGLAAAGAVTQSATVTAAQEAGSIFSVLQSGSLWLRLAEGVLGIILIAVGLARLTRAVPVATQIAKTVGTVGVI